MTASNILAVYQLASTYDRQQGLDWYPRAKKFALELVLRYDTISLSQAIGVIAALSPRNKWERNMTDAENLIRVHHTDPESVESVKVCTFGANKAKAIAILNLGEGAEVETVRNILSGPKLTEFFNCIIGEDDCCIDGHAYSVWAGDRITLADVPKIGVKLRREIKSAYAEAAEAAGISSSEMQAITWCAWRRLHGIA
jgi:hypothetical protein